MTLLPSLDHATRIVTIDSRGYREMVWWCLSRPIQAVASRNNSSYLVTACGLRGGLQVIASSEPDLRLHDTFLTTAAAANRICDRVRICVTGPSPPRHVQEGCETNWQIPLLTLLRTEVSRHDCEPTPTLQIRRSLSVQTVAPIPQASPGDDACALRPRPSRRRP